MINIPAIKGRKTEDHIVIFMQIFFDDLIANYVINVYCIIILKVIVTKGALGS